MILTAIKAMDSIHTDDELFRQCLRALSDICGRTGSLPTSYTVSKYRVTETGDLPFLNGFADVSSTS